MIKAKNEISNDVDKIIEEISTMDKKVKKEIMEDVTRDDKFALLYKINSHVNVAVKTPVGKTDRGIIKKGDVFGPMMCGKQIDEIGRECLESAKYTYAYKGEVEIPPLIMLDDLITISECGPKSPW